MCLLAEAQQLTRGQVVIGWGRKGMTKDSEPLISKGFTFSDQMVGRLLTRRSPAVPTGPVMHFSYFGFMVS